MSAIGPGDWVQKIDSKRRVSDPQQTTLGAIYQVAWLLPQLVFCVGCNATTSGFVLVGNPYHRCVQHYRLWPPPADEALRCEPLNLDEPVPA